MAITEFVAELHADAWPSDPFDRAKARSYAGEGHSGFNAIRAAMPCNTRARDRITEISDEVDAEVAGVNEIWSRASNGGLFGAFSVADIMFAPVAARFRTYA